MCSKRYDLGNNHILAQKNRKSRKHTVSKHTLQNLRMFLKYVDFCEHCGYNNKRRGGVTEWCTDMQE